MFLYNVTGPSSASWVGAFGSSGYVLGMLHLNTTQQRVFSGISSFPDRAAYLVTIRAARDFSDACRLMRTRKAPRKQSSVSDADDSLARKAWATMEGRALA